VAVADVDGWMAGGDAQVRRVRPGLRACGVDLVSLWPYVDRRARPAGGYRNKRW
jgi:hypothetical protein